VNKTRTTNEGVTVVQTALRSAPGSPYGQSGPVYSARGDKETGNDHEKRTWRERAHKNAAGNMVVPGVGFSHAIAAAAKHLGLQIPGKGKSTYTKHFERGLLVTDSLVLPEKVADLPEHWLFLPSDGVPGSGKRVWKCFPHVEKWEGVLEWMVLDPVLTEEVFTRVLVEAGRFIGIGFFRPQNRGWWGRFTVEDVQWGK
jgi:hypothetical protein